MKTCQDDICVVLEEKDSRLYVGHWSIFCRLLPREDNESKIYGIRRYCDWAMYRLRRSWIVVWPALAEKFVSAVGWDLLIPLQ